MDLLQWGGKRRFFSTSEYGYEDNDSNYYVMAAAITLSIIYVRTTVLLQYSNYDRYCCCQLQIINMYSRTTKSITKYYYICTVVGHNIVLLILLQLSRGEKMRFPIG